MHNTHALLVEDGVSEMSIDREDFTVVDKVICEAKACLTDDGHVSHTRARRRLNETTGDG